MERSIRDGAAVRRLLCGLLLPLLLALAQQGALLHRLSHWTAGERSHREQPALPDGDCSLCLAFAHVDAGAAPQAEPPPLACALSYAPAPAPLARCVAAVARAPRNRGPPAYL